MESLFFFKNSTSIDPFLVYSGDASFPASTSKPVTQVVGKAASTTAVSSSLNPSIYGQSVTFTATVVLGTESGTMLGNGLPEGAPLVFQGSRRCRWFLLVGKQSAVKSSPAARRCSRRSAD